jgi:hypothetical protein
MYEASIPLEYWDCIFESALFVINRLPSTPTGINSPFQIMFHQEPYYKFLRVLGCQCFLLLRPYNDHKLQSRSISCVFLGYSTLHKGYRCLDLTNHRLYISRHVQFNELNFSFAEMSNSPSVVLPTLTSTLTVLHDLSSQPGASPSQITSSSTHSSPSSVPHSTTFLPSAPTHHMLTRTKTSNLKPKQFPNHQLYHLSSLSESDQEPSCYSQAAKSPNWRMAMAQEVSALAHNNTWTLVPPPSHTNIVGCKWLFKIKRHSDGTIARHKARLVAK